MKKMAFIALIGLVLPALPLQAQNNLLHEFTGYDGGYPNGSLILLDSTLYGMTSHGGGNGGFGKGVIFKIQSDGTGYTILHKFGGGAADGGIPAGSLILSGTTLYGMTRYGGNNNIGTIFKIGIDGAGFALVRSFLGGVADGAYPAGSLILSGSTIYGVTSEGGDSDSGTIFKMETDGTGYTLLHKFAGGAVDGADPCGSLILSNSTLYGMTMDSGSGNSSRSWGTIFKMETDGTGYTLLHKFSGGAANGAYPSGSLILSASTLFGMTTYGGDSEKGIIFKLQTNGTGFTLLHKFAGGAADGAYPTSSPFLSGTTLFGMTHSGGDSDLGTIFKIQTDGSFFKMLHKFLDYNVNGAWPGGSLILSDSTLYGMTGFGGQFAFGVIFSLTVPLITVTSPNGGEKWREGSIRDITWASNGSITSVNIDYSLDSGANWISVAAGTAANAVNPRTLTDPTAHGIINDSPDGNSNLPSEVAGTANVHSYAWTIPLTPSTSCLVRVSDAANESTRDTSDMEFSILMNLDLLAERREAKAFSILRQYGLIQFMVGHPDVPVAQYRILRRKGSGDFVLFRTVAPSELQNSHFRMQDKYLEKAATYTYRVEAYNASGQLIGISREKTI